MLFRPSLESIWEAINEGIVIVLTFVGLPFYINAVKSGVEAIPVRLENVSRSLGASMGQTFMRVTIPLVWRSILVGLIMCSARAISEFGAVVIVAYFTGIKNVFPAKFKEKTAIMDGIKLEMDSLPYKSASCVAIRSEEIGLTELHEVSRGLNIVSGRMIEAVHKGSYVEIWVKKGNIIFRSIVTSAEFSRTNSKPELDITITNPKKSVLAI